MNAMDRWYDNNSSSSSTSTVVAEADVQSQQCSTREIARYDEQQANEERNGRTSQKTEDPIIANDTAGQSFKAEGMLLYIVCISQCIITDFI